MNETTETDYSLPVLKFQQAPVAILKACKEYREPTGKRQPNSNFLKGVKWSIDGSCLLTASEDTRLRVYDLPEDALDRASLSDEAQRDSLVEAQDSLQPALRICEGETIYDYTWFPAMHAADPVSCVFASTCRAHPVHLWDVCTGELRCSYRAYNAVDEMTAATSLSFSLDGSKLYGGFSKTIRIWDTSCPGREYQELTTFKKGADGLPGIVSCMAFNPDRSGLMAAGSYCGQAALYDSYSNDLLFVLEGQKGGLTQVRFSPDGNFLFTGARADPAIWCWDVRYNSGSVYKLERSSSTTNQRMYFDIEPCGRHLATGGQDGLVRVYELSVGEEVSSFRAADDTVNGFEFHPFLPLAATASGQRRFFGSFDSDSEGVENSKGSEGLGGLENMLAVWRFQHDWMTVEVGSLDGVQNEEGAGPLAKHSEDIHHARRTEVPFEISGKTASLGLEAGAVEA